MIGPEVALRFRRTPQTPFEVVAEPLERGVCLRVIGEIDLATVPELDDRLSELRSGRTPAVLDLSRVTFFDSTGLRALVRAARSARLAQTGFFIMRPSDPVVRVLEITGVADLLPLLDEGAAKPLSPAR